MSLPSVLIAEKDLLIAMDVQCILEGAGFAVCEIAAAEPEALRAAELQRPSLFITEIALEGKADGLSAAAHIRRTQHIPVIFVTGCSDETLLEQALLLEPAALIAKPFSPLEIKSAARLALSRHGTEMKLRRNQEFLQGILKSMNHGFIAVDLDGRVKLINEAAQAITGWTEKEALECDFGSVCGPWTDCGRGGDPDSFLAAIFDTGLPVKIPERLIATKDGVVREVRGRGVPMWDDQGGIIGAALIMVQTTVHKDTLQRPSYRRADAPKGTAPPLSTSQTDPPCIRICASCKRIPDKHDRWNAPEEYFRTFFRVEFTHGICPDCAEKLYGHFLKSGEKNRNPSRKLDKNDEMK